MLWPGSPEEHFTLRSPPAHGSNNDGECDIVICNIKFIFCLSYHFWYRAHKTLGISCDENDQGLPCYLNEVTFGTPVDGG